ncbi:MAG: response regulator, partial [Burkholderiales bacterium]|nr:response regulator [Burkholderiales bacterium]
APVAPAPLEHPAPSAAAIAATAPPASTAAAPSIASPALPPPTIDWQRFAGATTAAAAAAAERPAAATAVVRVRAGLLDRLVNEAGEVSITRARIDSDVRQMQSALGDLTDSLERMRRQLRDIEVQAETQISTRIEAAKAAAQAFDPLEMDRFTRFQELTRFMAESVNDVATLQRSLQRTLQSTEDQLAAQNRLTRELQDDLLRTRMVEFESLADRLYRTARQAARDAGKQVRLEIVGGAIEIDRGVLERMAGSFEHLLRNCVAHGIEAPAARSAAGKDPTGLITISVAQAGNEVGVDIADDGAGLDLARIRQRGIERGLVDAQAGDAELAQLIFTPGFSTAESVTELAGRGVGLDVVRAEVNGMGGRVETASEAGRGTRFKLLLPLTTAVTQVVMLRCGDLVVAVPSTLVELVRRVPSAEIERAYDSGSCEFQGEALPFFWLPALLQGGARGEIAGRTQALVVIRSASQRVALHIDEVVGNQEVVVKNVGPQLSRMPGLAGVTLLPSGAVALIYNPVALAALYGDAARARMHRGAEPARAVELQPQRAAMVLVVDDSLTVRRVTQRLLVREGYRVVTAKDGLEALERLAEERPALLLSDIEMPRMDGFDLVRNVRSDSRLADLPVVMITSRIAQKHRDYAAELGVDHYLGKPYAEEELLALVARYAGADILA